MEIKRGSGPTGRKPRPLTPTPGPERWNVEQTAAYLGMSKHTLRAMVRRGAVPLGVVIHLGRALRFNPERLRAWAEQGGTASVVRTAPAPGALE